MIFCRKYIAFHEEKMDDYNKHCCREMALGVIFASMD